MPRRKPPPEWTFASIRSGAEFTLPLSAYWEVEGDPISDDYTPDEIDADELLAMWAKRYGQQAPDGLVPIHWFVGGRGKFERMPSQYDHLPQSDKEDVLSFYTWPVNATTGEPLNWLALPVEDKLWNAKRSNKGGFIQQATGWKPSILQPFVYLPALLDAVR